MTSPELADQVQTLVCEILAAAVGVNGSVNALRDRRRVVAACGDERSANRLHECEMQLSRARTQLLDLADKLCTAAEDTAR